MANSPNSSDREPSSNSRQRLRLLLLSRPTIALGLTLLVGIIGGTLWGWYFIHNQLAPLIERNLRQSLQRPIQLGKVESFSFNSIEFDSLSIPATSTDSDRLVARGVKVDFDFWQLLLNQTLELEATLVQPDVYIQQEKDGTWVETDVATNKGSGAIDIQLEAIRVRNADVVLVPTPEPGNSRVPVTFDEVSGVARFLENNQRISFQLAAQGDRASKLKIQGELRPQSQQTNLSIQAENLLATQIDRLIKLPLDIQKGRVDGDVKVQLQPDRPLSLQGSAQLENVTAKIPRVPQRFTNTQGMLAFQGQQIGLKNVSTRYGSLPAQINGTINTQKGYNLTGFVRSASLSNVFNTFNIKPPVKIAGAVQANLQVTGAISQPIVLGSVSTIKPTQIDRVTFKQISTDFRLTNALNFTNIRAVPVVGGQITGDGRINLTPQGRLEFDLFAKNAPADALAQLYDASLPVTIGNVSANAEITGSTGNLQTVLELQAPEATYPGRAEVVVTNGGNILFRDAAFKVAGGTVQANGKITNGQFQAVVDASGVALSQFSQDLQGQLSTNLRLSGTSFALSDIQAQGQARLDVAGGTVNLNNISLNDGSWQAAANISQLELNQLSAQLRGKLRGNLRLAGNTDSFELSDIQAQGQVHFSQGLAFIKQPLTAQIRWNGEQIIVQRATAPGLSAQGTIPIRLEGLAAPQIAGLNLNVQAQDFNLQNLPFQLPTNVTLAGQTDFTGQITGTPQAPNVVGNIRLQNLRVNNLAFDSVLTGNLKFQPGQGTQLEVTGTQDRIAVNLDGNNRPISFTVRQDEALATGRTEGENLIVNVQDLPVAILQNLIPSAKVNLGQVAGKVSGNVEINLADSTAVGNIEVVQPRFGRVTADEFQGRFSFADGTVSLTEGALQLGESLIALSGNLSTVGESQFQISFDRAKIENVLQALAVYDLQDISGGLQPPIFADAEVVRPVPVGLPETSLLTQLRRFSEIEALLEQQSMQSDETSPLPALAQLDGTISGEIAGTGSLQSGLDVNFNLLGQDWQWGEYAIDEAIARGTYKNGVLTLLPLRIDLGDGLLAFTGQLGSEELSGQLQVESVPIATLKPFLPELPVEVAGDLNAQVTLAGSLDNPRAVGEVRLVEGTLNEQAVQAAQLTLNYNNARLNFDSTVLVSGTEPIEVTGSVPVGLPFASVQPDSNQISLNVNVQDEGLALLNLFSDRVTWVEGQGKLNIAVQGTLDRPVVTGLATVDNATLQAQALPEPLTDVTGLVRFEGDRAIVQNLQAQYNRGQLIAEGILPIFASQQATNNPLTVSLDNLSLNLRGLYRGGVSGNVTVTGTALDPAIGGTIKLMDGQISLGESSTVTSTPTVRSRAADGNEGKSETLDFTSLQLILGEDVRIARQPLVSFEARGDITLTGTLDNPRPQGVIRLVGGQVNLFTTQFNLARGYEQTATFTPNGGLNPILDIRLVARVPEVTRSPVLSSPLSGEIADVPITSFGSFETVRVQARVTGPANELAENLELTSDPSRSEAEIVALIGGSFINTLGQTDSTLGLLNLAGSALFTNLQGNFSQIGEAIGLSEVRVFPTIVTDPASEATVLSLAVEGVFDITNNFSVSASGVVAADQPFRFNLLYRLNDDLLVRGSTNFSGESRALVEYETRF